MLAGRRAFQGETISDTLAAVLRAEPDWGALPTEAGARLRDLLRRCLAKDPKQRLHAVADARLEIQAIASEPASRRGRVSRGPRAQAVGMETADRRRSSRRGARRGGHCRVVFSGVWPRASRDETRPLRVSVIHTEGSEVGVPAISPDGRRIAYRARRADGMPMLWVRDLDSFEARPLPGTEDAFSPFWSPDSRHLGFFAGRIPEARSRRWRAHPGGRRLFPGGDR